MIMCLIPGADWCAISPDITGGVVGGGWVAPSHDWHDDEVGFKKNGHGLLSDLGVFFYTSETKASALSLNSCAATTKLLA